MKIEYKKVIKIDELAHLVPTNAGATFSQLWQIFYYTRLFKYVHKKQFPKIKKSFDKICTHDKLQELCKLGYLKNPQKDIYCAKDKVLPILREADFMTETLPVEPQGNGDINELHNTEIFINVMKQPHFHTLLYPNFTYLIPDALLVLLDKEKNKYKLTFLEIEAKKPDWENYIRTKRDSYLQLASDISAYDFWKVQCSKLKINSPNIKDFCFSVSFYCSISKDFGHGFNFLLPK